eukprot:4142181-Amphidinium_carterae.2
MGALVAEQSNLIQQGLAPTTAKFAPRGPPASPCVPAAATAPPENRPQVPPAALEGLSEVEK